MSHANHPDVEAAVNRHLAEGQAKIGQLESQLKNLASDKGPQLKPQGGPLTRSNVRVKLKLEKELVQVKETMLQKVDQELKHASPEIRERCNYEVDKMLYPMDIVPEDIKELDLSQAMLSRKMYEKNNPPQPLSKSDQKTLDQSAQYMFQTRYAQELPAPDERLLEGKDIKTLDQSQDYAYQLRYRNEPAALGSNLEHMDRDIDIDMDR